MNVGDQFSKDEVSFQPPSLTLKGMFHATSIVLVLLCLYENRPNIARLNMTVTLNYHFFVPTNPTNSDNSTSSSFCDQIRKKRWMTVNVEEM